MTTHESKNLALISKLHSLTKDNKLNWQESVIDDRYTVAFSAYSITVSKHDGLIETRYLIEIIDSQGRTVEWMTSDDIEGTVSNQGRLVTAAVAMQEIYEQARRKALKADEIIDGVLQSLNEML